MYLENWKMNNQHLTQSNQFNANTGRTFGKKSHPNLPRYSNKYEKPGKKHDKETIASQSREDDLNDQLQEIFEFDPRSIEIKSFPQHKVEFFGLDSECRRKFIEFYSKLRDKKNVFEELFKKEVHVWITQDLNQTRFIIFFLNLSINLFLSFLVLLNLSRSTLKFNVQ